MKHLFSGIVAAFCILLLSCCKEVGPDINLHGNANSVSDTTYIESPVATPGNKNVLIEEFTGVECPNCPAGHAVVEGIQAQYATGRIAAIALHPNNALGQPFPFSQQNLIDSPSTTLLTYLGDPGFEPAGAVDRQLFSGQTSILTDRSYWQGFVASELALTPPLNIVLTDQYNSSSRVVTVSAEIHYTQAVTDTNNNITIMLTEDSITTAQLDGSSIDTFYVHNNVLRAVLTGNTGDNVAYNPSVTLVPGRVVRLVYQSTLNSLWKSQYMHVVAFVHEHATSQAVYQAAIIPLN